MPDEHDKPKNEMPPRPEPGTDEGASQIAGTRPAVTGGVAAGLEGKGETGLPLAAAHTVTVDFTVQTEFGTAVVAEQAHAIDFITTKIFRKPPAGHKIYALVGQVSSEWAHLEHKLDVIIWELTGGDHHQTACLTGQMMGHFARYNAIIALLTKRQMSRDLIKQAQCQQGQVSGLAEDRNRAVHDAWYVDVDTDVPHQHRSMPKRELTFGIKPHSTSDLESLLTKIASRIQDIDKLSAAIFGGHVP